MHYTYKNDITYYINMLINSVSLCFNCGWRQQRKYVETDDAAVYEFM